jgi:SAM-dependent methyltransferase
MFQINWRLKSLIYWFLYFIFFKKILFFIQKKITKRAYSSLGVMLYAYKLHYNSLKKYKSKKIFEFGAGKSLEQNIYLTFKFNNRINQTVIDIDKMIDFNLLNFAKNQLQKKIKLSFKTKNIRNLEDLKNILNIKYYAPINIIDFNEKEKFDAIISTNVIEHISKKHFEIILEKLRKIVKKNGILSFLIDYSDHYSHTDKNISSTNFMKYSEVEFKKYNTPLLFQNRLRHYDYIDIFKNKKFKILKIIKGPKGEMQNTVSDEFKKNHKDLFVTWGYFLLKKI